MIDNASSIPNQAMTHVPIGGMAKVYKATRGGGRIRNNALVGLQKQENHADSDSTDITRRPQWTVENAD